MFFSDGCWWNIISFVLDLICYYDMLFDGFGGLLLDWVVVIIVDLV